MNVLAVVAPPLSWMRRKGVPKWLALAASPQTRPIAILLGPEVTQTPEPE